MLIQGLLEFSKSILCKEEVLGKSYKAKIADIDVTVYFPNMPLPDPNNGMCIPLLPPEKGEKIKRGNENIIWGSPIAGREPNSSHIGVHAYVNCVLIEFEHEQGETIQYISQRIYEDAVRWENAFVNYCELCTKQNYNRYEQKNYGMEILSLWSHNGAIQSKEMQTITIEETKVSKFSNEKQIQDAIEFASAKKELLIEYQMLLSAYKARQQNLNRQIIIDACAAAELVLINTIIEYSQIKQIPQGELLRKYRTLGDRFEIVKEIDPTLPKVDYAKNIVDLRNDIAHSRNVYPSNEETDTLLETVEMLLKHFHKCYY